MNLSHGMNQNILTQHREKEREPQRKRKDKCPPEPPVMGLAGRQDSPSTSQIPPGSAATASWPEFCVHSGGAHCVSKCS